MERQSHQTLADRTDSHWWYVSRRTIIRKILAKSLKTSEHRKILEIGCGSGGNLQMLSEYGSLTAMEFDDENHRRASSRGICSVEKIKLEDNVAIRRRFDLICMLDVLEHINNDFAALQLVRQQLTEGGQLLITVPANKFLWTSADVVNHHYRRYTKKQLIDLIVSSRLTVEYASYFNTLLFPFISVGLLFLKRFSKRSASENFGRIWFLPLAAINKVLIGIFSSEKYFLPRISFPFGVSLLVVARKTKGKFG